MRPIMLFTVVALLGSGCANLPAAEPAAQPAPVIVGGYGPANVSNPDVAAAEKLAVDAIYKRDPQRGLVENVTREQQVVAGMNYRFTIKMTGVNSYRIVVYKPLQGEMTVTGYEKLTPAN